MSSLVTLPRIFAVLALTLPLAAVAAEPPKAALPAAATPAPVTTPAAPATAPATAPVVAPVASAPAAVVSDFSAAVHQLEQARSQIDRHHFRRARTLLHRAEAGLLKQRHTAPAAERAHIDGTVKAIKASLTALHHRNPHGALGHLEQALAQAKEASARS